MKYIRMNLKGQYFKVLFGPFVKLLEAVLELFVPLIVANIIDIGIKNNDTAYIATRGLIMLTVAFASAIFAMVCQYFAAAAAGSFGYNLRTMLYKHIMRLGESEIQAFGTDSLITRLSNDTNRLQNGLNMAIRLGSRVPFLCIGSIIMAFIINPLIGTVFLVSTPAILFILYIIMKSTISKYAEIQAEVDHLSRLSKDNLDGAKVIRAFLQQPYQINEFSDANSILQNKTIFAGKISALLNPLTMLVVNGAIIIIVWIGAKFVYAGAGEPGQIIALVSYMTQSFLALLVAANLIVIFTAAAASAERIAEVLDYTPKMTFTGISTPSNIPSVRFDNVSFTYGKEAKPSLLNIAFCVKKGEVLGVIGGTGSGKSTLARLINRTIDTSSGRVIINDVNVKDYSFTDLKSRIGMAAQQAVLFSGSIRENLTLSGQEISEDRLWDVLEIAQADKFVRQMPQGLDSILSEGGKNLSGGQRQRLTVARALAFSPDILVLDDCSSALDYTTDAALRERIIEGASERVTIIISQRVAAISCADIILVLDNGEAVGLDTHARLLESNKIYREICNSQGIY